MSTTVVPISDPGPDPITGIDPWPSLANAQNNSAIAAKNQAALYNASVLTVYMNAFGAWSASVTAGKISNANPPQPPLAWTTVVGSDGFSSAVIGTSPICALPPIPPNPPVPVNPVPGCVAVGIAIVGSSPWFTVGLQDSAPGGYQTPVPVTSADGVIGIFRKFAFFAGNGWYEKVG